jgi:hypothetical protein
VLGQPSSLRAHWGVRYVDSVEYVAQNNNGGHRRALGHNLLLLSQPTLVEMYHSYHSKRSTATHINLKLDMSNMYNKNDDGKLGLKCS